MSFSTSPLDAPALGWAAAVVRDRRHIGDRDHLQPVRLERPDGGLTTCARPLDEHFDRAHTILQRLARRRFGRHLRGVWCALARSLEAVLTGARPADYIARWVGDCYDRIV